MAAYEFPELINFDDDATEYRFLTNEHVRSDVFRGKSVLIVDPDGLQLIAKQAFADVSFYFRRSHLEKLAAILDDGETSQNDRFVAASLLRNAAISAQGELPSCQDTGTATIVAYKGEGVFTGANDKSHLSRGVISTFKHRNLRSSQMVPLAMFEEVKSDFNQPIQIDIYATVGNEYRFLFIAKGGGSSNTTALYQESKALLNDEAFESFLREKLTALGVSGCPPYHIAIVVGGTSPETNLRTVKLASAGYLDQLPGKGDQSGLAFRDTGLEKCILDMTRQIGFGAQFGGKYFALDVRVIRMPRHAGSCPVGIGVSCSADRNIKGKITQGGLFLERLDRNPERFLDRLKTLEFGRSIEVSLDQSMQDLRKDLSQYPTGTRLSLSGTLIVARDVAHARIWNMLAEGRPMPEYFRNHPVYYAGPARTPEGMVSGSLGPTTARRMDVYVEEFMKNGASLVMLGKGERGNAVAKACKNQGGFYLATIGGAGALFAKEHIVSVELVDFEDLGMEAVRRIKVRGLPAVIVCDDKGSNLYDDVLSPGCLKR